MATIDQSPKVTETCREAVGVFLDEASLQAAVDDLETHGFDKSDFNLLADEATIRQKLGRRLVSVQDFEDDPDAPRADYVEGEEVGNAEGGLMSGLMYVGAVVAAGAVAATGGTAIAVVAGAAAAGGGAGAAIGGFLARRIGKHHADYLREQIDHGGILLWVRTCDEAHERRAVDTLTRHSARDVHVHEIPQSTSPTFEDTVGPRVPRVLSWL